MEDKPLLAGTWQLLCFLFGVDGRNVYWWLHCLVNFPIVYMIRQLPLKMLHFYVFLSLAVFLAVQSFKFFSVMSPSWVFNHLNDFLVIPLVATLCLHGVWFVKKDFGIRLGFFTIISLVTLYSVFFEYYLPQQSHRYTGDILDVVSYAAGGTMFYFLQKIG